MTTETNPYTESQEVLTYFSELPADEASDFLKTCPFGSEDALNYIVAAMIVSKEVVEIEKLFGISNHAATAITGWAMANIIVLPMMVVGEE